MQIIDGKKVSAHPRNNTGSCGSNRRRRSGVKSICKQQEKGL